MVIPHAKGPVTKYSMKEEELIADTKEFVLFVPEKTTNDQGSIVCKMVHIVAIGLPVLVVWLAQPGSSKLCLEICQLLNPSALRKHLASFSLEILLSSSMSGI